MTTPEKVFAEATAALDERHDVAVLPARHRISAGITAQPVEGSGYVYGQVGWLDDDGNTYGLCLPDNMDRAGVAVRPLYICLGRAFKTPDGYIPGLGVTRPEDAEPSA